MPDTRDDFEEQQRRAFESAPLLNRQRYRISVDIDVDLRDVPRAKLEGSYQWLSPPPHWEQDAEGQSRLELQRRLIQVIADDPILLGYLMLHAAEYESGTALEKEYLYQNEDRDKAIDEIRLMALRRLPEKDFAQLAEDLKEHGAFEVCEDVFSLSFDGRVVSLRAERLD